MNTRKSQAPLLCFLEDPSAEGSANLLFDPCTPGQKSALGHTVREGASLPSTWPMTPASNYAGPHHPPISWSSRVSNEWLTL